MADPNADPAPDSISGISDGGDPRANQLDQVGNRKRILRVWQTSYLARLRKHVQFMQFGKDGLRPLVWLHSVDYPMAPPWGFCVDASDMGYSVISVRRPGFGETSPVEDTEGEVALLKEFLREAELQNAVLIVEGTSRPAGLQLALECPEIAYTLLVRPCYEAEESGSTAPWLRDVLVQALQSHAGASLSLAALKQVVQRIGPEWLYERMHADPIDVKFMESNGRDVTEAWECISGISAETFRRELGAIAPDGSLTPGLLKGLPALALTGAQMPKAWRNVFLSKSENLGIEAQLLPTGSFFAAYASDRDLLRLIKERA
jgi:pimeloyl-ACP methyl ester carboxylesterase